MSDARDEILDLNCDEHDEALTITSSAGLIG
jgi:hypothetical protein